MASITQHLVVAHMVNTIILNLEGEDLEKYIVGSVAADCNGKTNNKVPNASRQQTHFINGNTGGEEGKHDFSQYAPDLSRFIAKYRANLDKPFMLGYLVHLATDKYFFERFLPKKVTEHLHEINSNAIDYNDLTNKEYLSWYKPNFYSVFDDSDLILPSISLGIENLPDFSKFLNYKSPIEEVDSENLHALLVKLNKKYDELKSQKNCKKTIYSNQIVNLKEHFELVEMATDYIVNIIINLGLVPEKKDTSFLPKL